MAGRAEYLYQELETDFELNKIVAAMNKVESVTKHVNERTTFRNTVKQVLERMIDGVLPHKKSLKFQLKTEEFS